MSDKPSQRHEIAELQSMAKSLSEQSDRYAAEAGRLRGLLRNIEQELSHGPTANRELIDRWLSEGVGP